ncbi:hypothetical protein ACLKMH_15005 [Psychromonas sp. KJ10-10]|uniref:hypothetical protein n=1 Tax=Psychromonas sp. KJ10-10 TaxID=3391823 RepID=UPI0039B6D39D
MILKAIAGKTGKEQDLQVCSVCGKYSSIKEHHSKCPTCDNEIVLRKKHSLQKLGRY